MRAPELAALHEMTSSSILATLESGRMKWEAKFLCKAQKTAIADYLGTPNVSSAASGVGVCARDLDPPPNPPVWAGWGGNPQNSRFPPVRAAGLDRDQIKHLKLKWTFGFPGAAATFGQPTSFKGKLFVDSEDGTVYALDSATGCIWKAHPDAPAAARITGSPLLVGQRLYVSIFSGEEGAAARPKLSVLHLSR
jgi:polyvinyl alcohol dehydrogenase (cytochrome)